MVSLRIYSALVSSVLCKFFFLFLKKIIKTHINNNWKETELKVVELEKQSNISDNGPARISGKKAVAPHGISIATDQSAYNKKSLGAFSERF